MRLFSILALFIVSLSAFSQKNMENHFKIDDTRSKQIISIDNIVTDFQNADVMFFGEDFNDRAGQYLDCCVCSFISGINGNAYLTELIML